MSVAAVSSQAQVVALVGNPTAGSRTGSVARVVAEGLLPHPGAQLEVVDLADLSDSTAALENAHDRVSAAGVLVVATPVYKASFTGQLKVFLDGFEATSLESTVVVPVVLEASSAHSALADLQLRIVLQAVGRCFRSPRLFWRSTTSTTPRSTSTLGGTASARSCQPSRLRCRRSRRDVESRRRETTMPDVRVIDLHQHLWPVVLVEELRRRRRPPYLRGWRLWTDGEPPYDVQPSDHDPRAPTSGNRGSGVDLACVSLSAPLGIEALPSTEAERLLEAWHEGAGALPAHFRGWASVHVREPDLARLNALLADQFVGVQVPATQLLTPDAWLRAGSVLAAAERAGKPVLVHPGPVGPVPDGFGWWAPVVGYAAQLQAAWWSWQALDGRRHFPRLRLVFAAGAGLAPLQHERFVSRGGTARPVDPEVFVDSSSYGRQGLDALVRVLGIDSIVLGSDAPYGEGDVDVLGAATARRIRSDNPQRALGAVQSQEDAA